MPERKLSAQHVAFGAAVRAARKERFDWSQERLALEARMDRTYVSDVERGTRNIGYANQLKLAATLKMKLSELQADAEGRAG